MVTKISKNTIDKITYFKSRFEKLGYDEGHFVFATHAAFPVAITADLLYQLWANFKNYKDEFGNKKSVDPIAVSDLLLSGLVHATGKDVFEMDVETRAYLLEQLKKDERFGEARMKELGTFLYQYIDVVAIGQFPKSFIDAQQWTALASIAPDQAAKQISEALSKQINEDKSEEIIHMRNLLESYANQDERFESILHYTKGLKAAIFQMPMDVVKEQFDKAQARILSISDEAAGEKGILKIPILKSLKGKIEIEKEVLAPGTDEVLQRIAAMRKNGSTLLDLSKMELTRIPKEVFELEQLTELDLMGNNITRLPREIAQLKNLKKLLLKHNPIAYIDDSLTALTQLEVFKLDGGKLMEFPAVLLKMQSLVNISLEDNQISFLPPEITLLKNLRLLDLRGNPVLNLPSNYLKRTINTIHEYFESINLAPQKHYDPIALVLCPETENILLERDRIARQLAGTEKYLKIETLFNNTSVDLFKYCYSRPDELKILHFAAEGSFKIPLSEKDELVDISIANLLELIGPQNNIQLFFANVDISNSFFKEAGLLNFKTVIALNGKRPSSLDGKSASDFANVFYQNLVIGKTIQQSFDAAKLDFEINNIQSNPIQQQQQQQSTYTEIPNLESLGKKCPWTLYPNEESLEKQKSIVKKYMAEGKLELAFLEFEGAMKLVEETDLAYQIISIKGRYQAMIKDQINGLITIEHYNISLGQTYSAILNFIEDISPKDLESFQALNWKITGETQNLSKSLFDVQTPMIVALQGDQKEIVNFLTIYDQFQSPFLDLKTNTTTNETNYILSIEKDQMRIERWIGKPKLIHGINGIMETSVEHIKDQLEKIEKWERIKNLENDKTDLDVQTIDLQIYKTLEAGNYENDVSVELVQSDKVELPYLEQHEKQYSPAFQLKIINKGKQELWLNILFMEEDFSILNNVFPSYNLLPGQEAKLSLVESNNNTIPIFIDDKYLEKGIRSFTNHLKFIITEEEFDTSRLNEKAIQMEIIELKDVFVEKRGTRGTFGIDEEDFDWFTKTITLHITKPELKTQQKKKTKSTPPKAENKLEELKNNLKRLLANNEIENVFKVLENELHPASKVANNLIMTQSRFNRNTNDQIKGIISRENYQLENNKITNTLLYLIDDIKEKDLFDNLEEDDSLEILA